MDSSAPANAGLVTRLTPEDRHEIYQQIAGISSPRRSFYIMVAISTTIATYGLLANSTAVVIGAMLVAPLMGPIFGVALSLAAGDQQLFRQSALAEAGGVLLCIALGAAIGAIPLRLGFGSEIIARTQPTLYDLIVALASGLAGAYALMDRRISPALPGVAIATALVPPLTTCGLCLSAERWDWAWGAFLLFVANFLSIEIAAAVIFGLFGLAGAETPQAASLLQIFKRFRTSLLALGLVSVFMTQTLLGLIDEWRVTSAIESTLSQELRERAGALLSETRMQKRDGSLEVIATVLTPQEFEPAQVARLEEVLQRRVDPGIRLIVRSLLSRDADRDGPVFLAAEEQERRVQVEEQTRFLADATRILTEQIDQIPGARVVELRRESQDGTEIVTAVLRAPTAVKPAQVAAMEAALRRQAGRPVRLVVRSILIREANAGRYLHQPPKKPKPSRAPQVRSEQRLEQALQNQLRGQMRSARLTGFSYSRRNGRLSVVADVRGRRLMRSSQVRRIEAALRRYVYPDTDLTIRSTLGAEITP